MMAPGYFHIKAITCCWITLIVATGLVVAQFPTVQLDISDEILEPGLETTLSCRVQDQGAYRISIEKQIKIGGDRYIDTVANDNVISEKYSKTGRFSIRKIPIGRNGLYVMDMKNVTFEDTATYICKVSGTSQRDEKPFAVYKKPTAVGFDKFRKGDIITFTEGISRSITCLASESNPVAEIRIKVGSKVQPKVQQISHEHIARCYATDASNCILHYYYDAQATLSKLVTSSEDDGKMLTCEASLVNSKQKPVSTMIEISVLYSPKIYCDRNHTASLNSAVEITCTVESNPAPTSIIWRYKGDPMLHKNSSIISGYKVVDTNNIYSITKTNNSKEHTVTLHIPQVLQHHYTTFTLDVANSVGNASAQVVLINDGPEDPANGGESSGVPFYAPLVVVLSVLSLVCISCCKR